MSEHAAKSHHACACLFYCHGSVHFAKLLIESTPKTRFRSGFLFVFLLIVFLIYLIIFFLLTVGSLLYLSLYADEE